MPALRRPKFPAVAGTKENAVGLNLNLVRTIEGYIEAVKNVTVFHRARSPVSSTYIERTKIKKKSFTASLEQKGQGTGSSSTDNTGT